MNDIWFVCLKHGTKYSAEYVNVLHSMFKRNIGKEVRFACYTENSNGLNKDIEVFSLPVPKENRVQGWWYKPYFFNPEIPTQGTILFCDLDVVIFRNLDKFYDYNPGKFCILRDFTRALRPHWKKFNSSVFRLETDQCNHVYENFMQDTLTHIRRNYGDQDYIYSQFENRQYDYFPDRWAESYKWEMRARAPLERKNGIRNFACPGEPKIHPETSIAVFHGEPNPSQCEDNWVVDNWR